jgi:hypothetical protein
VSRRLLLAAAPLLASGCVRAVPHHGFVRDGDWSMWLGLVLGGLGALFPSAFASHFLDDPAVVRLMGGCLFLACGFLLADLYFI